MRVLFAVLPAALFLAGCMQAEEAPPAPSGLRGGVAWELGADATGLHAPRLEVVPAGDAFHAALRGVPGATVHADELLRLRASDARPHLARLSADPAASPFVREARLTFYAEDVEVARLDLRADAPEALVLVPAALALRVAWTLTLAEDAPADLDLAQVVRMDVTA